MYIPFDKTVTLSLRYELPESEMLRRVKERLGKPSGKFSFRVLIQSCSMSISSL
jgi:hypothetical protein